mgnify:CR=1 FL=1
MKDIAIYGAGGLGREVACLIRNINAIEPQWNLIGFFDDGIAVGSQIGTFGTVLGGRAILNRWDKPLDVAICLGNPKTEEKVYNNIENPLITYRPISESQIKTHSQSVEAILSPMAAVLQPL